jgi:hypothetical protein
MMFIRALTALLFAPASVRAAPVQAFFSMPREGPARVVLQLPPITLSASGPAASPALGGLAPAGAAPAGALAAPAASPVPAPPVVASAPEVLADPTPSAPGPSAEGPVTTRTVRPPRQELFDKVYAEVREEWARNETMTGILFDLAPKAFQRSLIARRADKIVRARLFSEDARQKAQERYRAGLELRHARIEASVGMPPPGDAPVVALGPSIESGRAGEVFRRADDPSRAVKVLHSPADERTTRRLAGVLNWLARQGLDVEPVELVRLADGRLALDMRYFSPRDGWYILSDYQRRFPAAAAETEGRAWNLLRRVEDKAAGIGVGVDRSSAWRENVAVNAATGRIVSFDPIWVP